MTTLHQQPPPIPNLERKLAVRRVLVDHLAGKLPTEHFLITLPALLEALTPHLAPDPPGSPTRVLHPEVPMPRRPRVRGSDELTDRELEVLRLAAEGLTNYRIGERLGLSEDTAKTHLARIRKKLGGAQSRGQAVALAYQQGILP